MDIRRTGTALRCAIAFCWLTAAASAQFYTPGDLILMHPDSIALGRISLNVDTLSLTAREVRIIDSIIVARGIDSVNWVGTNRNNDIIAGTKTFLGTVKYARLGSSWGYSAGQWRAWYIACDTSTLALGDTLITISPVGTDQQIFQLYENGILDLPQQSSARRYHNTSNQLIFSFFSGTAKVDTSIYLGTVSWDNHTEFHAGNVSTGTEFWAKESGTYLVNVSLKCFNLVTTLVTLDLMKSFSAYASSQQVIYGSSGNVVFIKLTTMIQLNKDDVIKLRVSADDGVGSSNPVIQLSLSNYFEVLKVM